MRRACARFEDAAATMRCSLRMQPETMIGVWDGIDSVGGKAALSSSQLGWAQSCCCLQQQDASACIRQQRQQNSQREQWHDTILSFEDGLKKYKHTTCPCLVHVRHRTTHTLAIISAQCGALLRQKHALMWLNRLCGPIGKLIVVTFGRGNAPSKAGTFPGLPDCR